MYQIIQNIYEKNNKILKEGIKRILNWEDVSSLTSAIKDFTDILGKELFSEIVTQIEKLVFENSKRQSEYEAVRFAGKSLITKNGKTKFERRYYKDNETGKNVCLTYKILGIDKGGRIDKKVKETKTYLMNPWNGIEAHDIYKDKLTGCCQEGQVHHTLSERLSTDAKVWSGNGIYEMRQLRAFTQNKGDIYQKLIDILTLEKRENRRIRKKDKKKSK